MLFKSSCISMVFLLVIAGCASPYAKRGVTGGYNDIRIDTNHYRVRFDGNGYTKKETVWIFWFYRCAEVTKENGFQYFVIEPIKPQNKTQFLPHSQGCLQRACYHPRFPRGSVWASAPGRERRVPNRLRSAFPHPYRRGKVTRVARPVIIYYSPGVVITTWHSNAIIAMYDAHSLPPGELVFNAQSVLDLLGPFVKSGGKMPAPDRDQVLKGSRFIPGALPPPPPAPSVEPSPFAGTTLAADPGATGEISPAGAQLGARYDAMDIEHHWLPGQRIDWQTGNPTGIRSKNPHAGHGSEFLSAVCSRSGIFILNPRSAREQIDWLIKEGETKGWAPVASPFDAQRQANAGQYVVAGYASASGIGPGIVAMVRPSAKPEAAIQAEGPQVIHVGSENTVSTSLKVAFRHFQGAWDSGSAFQVRFFAHAAPD